MIELSDDQLLILQTSADNPLEVINPRTREKYVLVRREMYDRLSTTLDQDFTCQDAFQAQIDSAAAAGWDDPALDVYNDLGPHEA